MLSPKSVDISNNSWISQVKEGIVDKEATSGGGMEDGELCIFYSSSEEIGDRVGTGMKGDGIEWGVF